MNNKELKNCILESVFENKPPEWSFDFRPSLLSFEITRLIAKGFWQLYEEHYPFQICGMEFSGIPLALAIQKEGLSFGLNCNVLIYRKNKKSKTNKSLIEGYIKNEKIIYVDDIISSGNSLKKVIHEFDLINKNINSSFSIIDFKRNDIEPAVRAIEKKCLFTLQDFGIEKFELIE